MPSSKETMIMLFFNCPTSFHLLYLFFHTFSISLAKFIHYVCLKTTSKSTDDVCEPVSVEDLWYFCDVLLPREEDLVEDIICDGEALSLSPMQTTKNDHVPVKKDICIKEPVFEDQDHDEALVTQHFHVHSRQASKSGHHRHYSTNEEPTVDDRDSIPTEEADPDHKDGVISSIETEQDQDGPMTDDDTSQEECDVKESHNQTIETNITEDGKYLVLEPKNLQFKETDREEHFQDLFTDESASKSSSEWRSSLYYRDSATEDPLSSSSRRSCPTWESCTLFRKYDEEMMFFDRFSAQKLSETESLRAIQARPRSVSQRIVHKITTRTKVSEFQKKPYHELESAYVAQICLTWEALNWNYKIFKQLKASREEGDLGCPGQIAQQFQQFQVLLQRFIENEPYERGRRPEVYARMRSSAPKLLQVPEFSGSEADHRKGGPNTMISAVKFLRIMEEAILTFMNFLKADRQKPCQIVKAYFGKKHRRSVDQFLLHLMKKTNKKKKRKLKDLYKTRKCFRKPRMKEEDVMEIVMCMIDLKVVSRVLRMFEISQEQLNWCEEKMNKVKVWEGKVRRDSSPLFFPNTLTHHHSMLMLDD